MICLDFRTASINGITPIIFGSMYILMIVHWKRTNNLKKKRGKKRRKEQCAAYLNVINDIQFQCSNKICEAAGRRRKG